MHIFVMYNWSAKQKYPTLKAVRRAIPSKGVSYVQYNVKTLCKLKKLVFFAKINKDQNPSSIQKCIFNLSTIDLKNKNVLSWKL